LQCPVPERRGAFVVIRALIDELEDNMKIHTAMTAAALVLAPSIAFAQSTTATGAVNGAEAGGTVAGPVGAVVGGTVGAAVGAALEIPNAVINSVRDEPGPSVVVREEVAVGRPLPERVVLRPIQRYPQYRYAVVNERHVIVEPRTRRVVRIID
jgi:hypothetical protein